MPLLFFFFRRSREQQRNLFMTVIAVLLRLYSITGFQGFEF